MSVCALCKIYLEQSTITELISHPSSRPSGFQPITPRGVLPPAWCVAQRQRRRLLHERGLVVSDGAVDDVVGGTSRPSAGFGMSCRGHRCPSTLAVELRPEESRDAPTHRFRP